MSSLTFENVAWLCERVDLSATQPTIDLSDVTFITPFAMVYLGMFLRHHTVRGKAFEVVLPTSMNSRGYLTRQNFWERFNFNADELPPDCRQRLRTTTSLNDIIDIERREGIGDELSLAVMEMLSREGVDVDLASIGEIVGELVENFREHAERTLAAFAVQWYPKGSRIDVVIGDCGVGIRQSLARNPSHRALATRPHDEVAVRAFEAGVTTRPSGGGTGLTVVREHAQRLRGMLRLSTGDGYVSFDRRGSFRGRMRYDLPGVQVEVSIPTRG